LREKNGLFRAITQTFIAIAIIVLEAGSVWAFYMELIPSLTWQFCYEDNIDGVLQNQPGKLSGFSNRYLPGLKFTLASSKLSVTGETLLRVNRYLSEREFDKTDRDYSIAGKYKLTPRSEFNLSAHYTLNSDPQRYLTDASGFQPGVLVRNTQDETKSYMANYDYSLTTRNSLSFMFTYTTLFSSQFNNSSDLYIYNASFTRMLSAKDKLTVAAGYNHFLFSYGIADAQNLGFKMDTYSINTGIAHEFSDTFNFNFNVGWYVSETEQRRAIVEQDPDTGETIVTGTEIITNSTPGSNFSFLMEKKYFHTSLQFQANRALGTNPDNGQTYPSTNIQVYLAHDLTGKLRGTCSWSYFSNKATAGEYNNRTTVDNTTYVSALGLQYQYRRNITLALQYSRAESKYVGNQKTIMNTVYLECRVALQRPFIVR
jgi:hypothetical protein